MVAALAGGQGGGGGGSDGGGREETTGAIVFVPVSFGIKLAGACNDVLIVLASLVTIGCSNLLAMSF